ncbi:hypothetical protein NDU88_004371, partial [Pleurodeles waltl]
DSECTRICARGRMHLKRCSGSKVLQSVPGTLNCLPDQHGLQSEHAQNTLQSVPLIECTEI